MQKNRYKWFMLLGLVLVLVAGCSAGIDNEAGEFIISAEEALAMKDESGVILVDAQNSYDKYEDEHVAGAISITRPEIMINEPVNNMLPPAEQIETVMGEKGISNESTLLIYDSNNNMDASRLWYTLFVYGHDETKLKVISGGLDALKAAGADVTEEVTTLPATTYATGEFKAEYYATIDDVIDQLNYPDPQVKLLDTRSTEEFNDGTIPTSILIPYDQNNEEDGTFKDPQDIRIMYMDNDLYTDNTMIMYCKTSVRGAETFVALYNAGYRNLKIYDGAYLEWSSDSQLPIQRPEGEEAIEFNQQDAS
jgi:thiosulfate/3-mercaptopyruvate sulfurtransferase